MEQPLRSGLFEARRTVSSVTTRAGDEYPASVLAAGAAHPAFRDRVHARRLDGSADDPYTDHSEHRVERGAELGVSVPDQELRAVCLTFRSASKFRAC
jgi:hypothetical protein